MYAYTKELKLEHNELPAIYNVETGELDIKSVNNDLPTDKILFQPTKRFKKDYTDAWKYLSNVLNPEEFRAAYLMAIFAKANTNSLEPMNQDTTKAKLSELLKINKNNTERVLDSLFKHGVFGTFNVCNDPVTYKNYWILNPYLSFNGKYIDKGIVELFKDTLLAKLSR